MTDLSFIRGFLFDLDGVLYVGERPIEGAQEALKVLSHHYPCRFITNTSTRSVESLHRKLKDMGFTIAREAIISAPQAVLLYLQSQPDPVCHLLLDEDVRRDFAGISQSDVKADYVVLGDIGQRWNYTVLNRAFRILFEGAELIAVHKNRFWQTEEGLNMDIGGFVAALEYATGKQARLFGKPSADFFRMALEDLGLEAGQVSIVGDDIDSDIDGGMKMGLAGILVRTGKYRESYVRHSKGRPDLVIDSIRDLPSFLGIR